MDIQASVSVGHENLRTGEAFDKPHPTPEVLLTSTASSCHQRDDRVHLAASAPEPALFLGTARLARRPGGQEARRPRAQGQVLVCLKAARCGSRRLLTATRRSANLSDFRPGPPAVGPAVERPWTTWRPAHDC